jgi:peptidoglycan-associated lipoprotein
MRQTRGVIVSSTFVIAVLLVQGCAAKWWWESESGQEEFAQEERINDPAIKEIPPDGSPLTDQRSELLSRNDTGLADGKLVDVLFDFDRDSIRMDAMPVLEADAKQLHHERVSHLLLEGRGDEFGTSAYNLVLGERRARNVQSYLRELGLSIDVKTTSYGKDRPLCVEHSGDCRQRNRSVHFFVK